jgi:hypothetical protein
MASVVIALVSEHAVKRTDPHVSRQPELYTKTSMPEVSLPFPRANTEPICWHLPIPITQAVCFQAYLVYASFRLDRSTAFWTADGDRPYKQLATKNLPKIRTIGASASRELSGNDDSTGYVAVALPVGSLAGEEGAVRRRLHVAIDVERPRRDFVLARGGRPPVEPPEPPGVAR